MHRQGRGALRRVPVRNRRPDATFSPIMTRHLLQPLSIALAIGWASCSPQPAEDPAENPILALRAELPVAMERGKLLERDGRPVLWGGQSPLQDFDISAFDLEPSRLHFGLGRENFAALIDPAFVSADAADAWLPDTARVLVVAVGEEVHVYPHRLLARHELVNDVVGGQPVFAGFCTLSNYSAVYDRTYGGRTFTFGLSGYSHYDPTVWDGRDVFVLWDRETESLWWPPYDRAVSGVMKGVRLRRFSASAWAETTWGAVKARYARPVVLAPGQDFSRPGIWPRLSRDSLRLSETDVATTDTFAPEMPQTPRALY